MTIDVRRKNVAVVGLGVEGLSSAAFLVKQGATVTILDKRVEKSIDPSSLQQAKDLGVKLVLGNDYLANLTSFDVLVRSPGVRKSFELFFAEQKGVIITSQIKLFFDVCPCPIIGITGTKGKGTTTTLIHKMLKASSFDSYLGGNIGMPPFTFLNKLTKKSWVVLELSSFQLQDITKSPHIAVMLMVTSEHLDYHRDVYEYIDAKRNIVRFQTNKDFAILNPDYPATNESDIYTKAKVFHVSRERGVLQEGCFVQGGNIVLRQNGKETEIIQTTEILLPGRHNLENVCAAVMAAILAGAKKEAIVQVLKTFKGLEHRIEEIATINGATYYDDSFSTTPETAIAAIEAFDKQEILILGGSSKKANFEELGKVISQTPNIKAIVGIGGEWPKIKSNIKNQVANIEFIEGCKTMQEIVLKAWEIAEPGDVVLLSPACASFDMFKNYKERGEQFKKEVEKLAHDSV